MSLDTSKPRTIRNEDYGRMVMQSELHDMACEFVEDYYQRGYGDETFNPLWLLAFDTIVRFVVTPWEDQHMKVVSIHWIRDILRLTGAHAYASITEAWSANMTKEMSPADQELLRKASKTGLSSLPKRLRDDVIIISSHGGDHGKDYAMSRYLINKRRPIGPNFLGPRVDEKDGAMEGRMWNLLKPDPEADARLLRMLGKMKKRFN